MNHDKQNRNFWSSMKEKGYYIALTLCAVAIGVSGYLYYRTTNQETNVNAPVSGTTPGIEQPVSAGNDGSVEVIGTTPSTPGATTPSTPSSPTTPSTPTDTKLEKTAWPLEGDTVAAYAMEALAYNKTTQDWRVHDGLDLSAEVGAQVKAAADGTVYTVYEDDSMGVTVVLRHAEGYATTYSSLSKDVRVKAGDTVTCGQVIGSIGETALVETALGPHLHFAVTCDSKPVDPEIFLNRS